MITKILIARIVTKYLKGWIMEKTLRESLTTFQIVKLKHALDAALDGKHVVIVIADVDRETATDVYHNACFSCSRAVLNSVLDEAIAEGTIAMEHVHNDKEEIE